MLTIFFILVSLFLCELCVLQAWRLMIYILTEKFALSLLEFYQFINLTSLAKN